MADFPVSPTLGQTFTSEDGSVWTWDGYTWRSESGFGGSGGGGTGNGNVTMVVSNTAPIGSNPNTSLWWDNNTGFLRIYYNDGDTNQWVDAFAVQQGIQGIEGSQGTIGLQGTQGTTGTQGTVGSVGVQGVAGSSGITSGVRGAAWSNTGTIITPVNEVQIYNKGSFEIVGWSIVGDTTGSCSIDVRKKNIGSLPATSGDSIVAAAAPSLSSQRAAYSTTLTGWTTTVNDGDILVFVLSSSSSFSQITFLLHIEY